MRIEAELCNNNGHLTDTGKKTYFVHFLMGGSFESWLNSSKEVVKKELIIKNELEKRN